MSPLLSTILIGKSKDPKERQTFLTKKEMKLQEKLSKAKDYLFETEYDPCY